MKLTALQVLSLALLLAACGGASQASESPSPTGASTATTPPAPPSVEERAQLLSYDQSAPLDLQVKKTSTRGGAKVADVTYAAGDHKVSAFLVRPAANPRAAVLALHWYGEGANANRSEFLPDALELARDGVVSLLPQGRFPWKESVSEEPANDVGLIRSQVVDLRRGLDVLAKEAPGAPIAFAGHDYGAMFGSLLVADRRPQAYVLMAPDATFSNWFIQYFARGASKPAMDAAFAPFDPVNNVRDAPPARIFFQFARSDRYVPSYIADKLAGAAGDAKVETYAAGHELNADARKDRIAWLRGQLGL